MTRSRGKISLMCAAMAAAAALLGGATAFACTNLATLTPGTRGAKAGTAVTVTGSSFAAPKEGAAPSPVAVRWNRVGGPVLATLVPDASGTITGSFTPLETTPGHYVVIATQVDEKGENQFGTPARMPFEILGPTGESVSPPVRQYSSSSSDSNSSVPLVLLGVLGIGAVGLFAAGLASFQKERSRQGRLASVPTADPGSNRDR